MTRSRVMTIAGTVGALAVGAVALGLVFRGSYETEQTSTRSFVMPEDFTAVRKILVRKDGAQQLVAMGGSTFLGQQWSGGGVDVGAVTLLDPKWRLDLHGTLKVRTQDDYVGQQDIALEQDVVIEPDFLHSEVELDKPAERLRDYRMTTHFSRAESAARAGADGASGTRVELKLSQRILTDAPWFAHRIADRRVLASVERTLENQEAAIRKLVAENIDDVPLLPLR
ncbi:MAG TPA: hypothetical protein VEQ85_05725 [Lacipirellulaceae bacterium]|nr:hypothetical protein [Lacipirellulaceae bacterium]